MQKRGETIKPPTARTAIVVIGGTQQVLVGVLQVLDVPRNTFAGLWGTEVRVFVAPHQNPNIFFGIVHFKHPHHRYPKPHLLACRVKSYGILGRHPRTPRYFLALRSPNTPIIGIQKHLCWPMGYSVMGIWSAILEPKQFFWHCAVQTPPS